jgi:hypothetical protein
MPFNEDLTAFLAPAEFATSVLVAGQPVAAIFDNGYALGGVGVMGMASSQPALTLATASVAANPVGATVQVGATSYLVAAHEPDGTGISRLLLEATA